MIKAVVFDLYETLITEWVSRKYLSSQCARDLGIDPSLFRELWNSCHHAMDTGRLSYRQVLTEILIAAGKTPDDALMAACEEKRITGKNDCFAVIDENVLQMLSALKQQGLKLCLCSNCSADEVEGLLSSSLHPLFDAVILSYQVGLAKPDRQIYLHCTETLSVLPEECLFVGDGGSRELFGAGDVGMHPLRALWFPEKYHAEIAEMPFPAAHAPRDVLAHLNSL
ncbi:MAG: HAD-IA family hydrolase [Clostridia bacterium]|nr:HAD-IA family hydrolase [Clostridia bacterium]